VVYRIDRRGYLTLSVTYGQFLLSVPFTLSVYAELSRWSPAAALAARWQAPATAAGTGLLLVAVVAAAALYGWIVTWARYRHFEVRAGARPCGPRAVWSRASTGRCTAGRWTASGSTRTR